jgi:hypothetical protein
VLFSARLQSSWACVQLENGFHDLIGPVVTKQESIQGAGLAPEPGEEGGFEEAQSGVLMHQDGFPRRLKPSLAQVGSWQQRVAWSIFLSLPNISVGLLRA